VLAAPSSGWGKGMYKPDWIMVTWRAWTLFLAGGRFRRMSYFFNKRRISLAISLTDLA